MHGFDVPSTASHVWKAIMSQMPIVQQLSRWLVGRRDLSFWYDNWYGTVLEGPRRIEARLLVKDALPRLGQLIPLVCTSQHANIARVRLNSSIRDKLIFVLSKSGDFETA